MPATRLVHSSKNGHGTSVKADLTMEATSYNNRSASLRQHEHRNLRGSLCKTIDAKLEDDGSRQWDRASNSYRKNFTLNMSSGMIFNFHQFSGQHVASMINHQPATLYRSRNIAATLHHNGLHRCCTRGAGRCLCQVDSVPAHQTNGALKQPSPCHILLTGRSKR